MGKFFGHLIGYIVTICISLFTASRLFHLLGIWLPVDQPLLPWLALCAFEAGMWGWVLYFRASADGSVQRSLALAMIIVDFLAVAAATIGDFYIMASMKGQVPAMDPDTMTLLTVGIGGVFVLNVAAHIGTFLGSTKARHQWAQQDANDTLQDAKIVAVKEQAVRMAPQYAMLEAQQWGNQAWSQLMPGSQALMLQAPAYHNQYSPASVPPPPPAVETTLAQVASAPQHPSQPRAAKKFGLLGRLGKAWDAIAGDDQQQPQPAPVAPAPAPAVNIPTQPASQPARSPRPFLAPPPVKAVSLRRSPPRKRKPKP